MKRRFNNSGKTLAQSLWERVDTSGDCWEWLGTKDEDGYGLFTYKRKSYKAHRVAWAVSFGDIPRGLLICHSCDNPSCARPEHLMLGSHRSNAIDRKRKGRSATGDKSGSRIHHDRVREGVKRWIFEQPEKHARGESAGMAKLKEADIHAIRRMYGEGMRQIDIAAQFNIAQAHVSSILLRKSWKHIE